MFDDLRRSRSKRDSSPLLRRLAALGAVVVLTVASVGEASAQKIGRGPTAVGGERGPMRGGFGRGGGGGIGGIAVPLAIGIIGAIASTPARSDPGLDDAPPPRRTIVRKSRPPRRGTRNAGNVGGGSGAPPAGERRFVPDEVLAQLPSNASDRAIAQTARRFRLTTIEQRTFQLTGERLVRYRIADRRPVATVIRALERAGVRSQPNYLFALQDEASGAGKGDPAQYALAKLHIPEAQTLSRGDKVLVGVIDSGIDATHPELAGTIAARLDAVAPEANPNPHGTAIAGTIAAHARLLGVAPGARILAVTAFSAAANGAQATTFNILEGIDWAAAHGARVINMSFAGPRDPAIERELAGAHKKRIVLVAAAGNAGRKSPPLYPAAEPQVIAVSATDSADHFFAASNQGRYISVAAPGVDILAPAPGASYQVISGTSLSAAYISGLAALLLQRQPDLEPDDVRRLLQASAHDLGPKGRDNEFGAGLADAYAALKAADASPRVGALTSSRR